MRPYLILFALLLSVLSAGAYDFTSKGLLFRITDRHKRTVEVTHWDEWTGANGVPDHYRPDLCSAHHHGGTHVHDEHCEHHIEPEHKPVIPVFPDTIVIPSKVWYKGRRYTVTAVGDGSFYGRENIVFVRLPKTVTRIGQSAFRACGRLRRVEWTAAVDTIDSYAFYMDYSLESVALPDSLKQLGVYAFAICDRLRYVTMPAGLASFEGNAFLHCRNLKQIILHQMVPPVVKDTGIKMNFSGITFVIPPEAVPVYRKDRYWSKQNY